MRDRIGNDQIQKASISKININFLGEGKNDLTDSKFQLPITSNATPMNDSPRETGFDQHRQSIVSK